MNRERLAAEISARLRAERARLNLTLREAERLSGVHYVTLSRYEQGSLPTVESLYRLAEVYGVDVVTLLPPLASVADLPKRRKK